MTWSSWGPLQECSPSARGEAPWHLILMSREGAQKVTSSCTSERRTFEKALVCVYHTIAGLYVHSHRLRGHRSPCNSVATYFLLHYCVLLTCCLITQFALSLAAPQVGAL